jgi:hypothetical protein
MPRNTGDKLVAAGDQRYRAATAMPCSLATVGGEGNDAQA